MKRVVIFLFVLIVAANQGQSGEIIGQLTDPCDMGIDEYTDIVSAWVEKDGSNLTFYIETRGDIPQAQELPEYDDTITYLWLVDADTNPKTGQSTWNLVGSEFNVRAVISQDPGRAGGFVDVTGAMEGGGGNGSVAVQGNRIQITIDRSQIASVKRFSWKSDTFKDFYGYGESYNLPTVSALARVGKYGVVYDINYYQQSVGENRIAAYLADDPCTPVIDMTDQRNEDFGLFLSIERKYPDQDNYLISGQATSHSGMNHLRTFSRLDVENADPSALGQSEAVAMFDCNFRLDGQEGQSGPVPEGVFFLKYNHNYHIFAYDDQLWQTTARTFAQIVLNEVDPLIQKGVWVHQRQVWNDDFFASYDESIDLADYGFEFGITYRISTLLADLAEVPIEMQNSRALTDSTFITSIEAVGPAGDLDGDWDVDMTDLAKFANNWLEIW